MPGRRFSLKSDNRLRKLVNRLADNFPIMFGTNMAIRASAYNAIGREFCRDVEDVLHEDVDISIHFGMHGYKVQYCEDMVAAMSARRINNKRREFVKYQQRMITTFVQHGLHPTKAARFARRMFLIIYFPLHAVSRLYGRRWGKIEVQMVQNLWNTDGALSSLRRRSVSRLRRKMSGAANEREHRKVRNDKAK
jgi:hypothetical protein